ncbi:hypothetical protein PENTCL1PPCAC_27397, partial [Pristionchus entomophagus]
DSPDFIGFVIIGSSFLRLYVSFTIVFLLVALSYFLYTISSDIALKVIERLLATILVRDYEQNDRRWISMALLTIVFISTVIFGLDNTCGIFRMSGEFTFGIIIVLSAGSGVTSLLIYVRNKKRLNILTGARSQYTLSERYQLREYIRAFKFLLIVGFSGSS